MKHTKNPQMSVKQSEFIKTVLAGHNVYLTGKAGTGKSFVVSEAIKVLKEKGKRVVALAPTGMAANHIGGQTIHSMFSLNPYGILSFDKVNYLRSEKRRILDAVDVMFIDEISMLRPDILDAINWTLVKNGCSGLQSKQVVFVGDMKQLPVVLDDNSRAVLFKEGYKGEEFFNAKIYERLDVKEIELDEVLRQTNEEFLNHLNIIREGGKSDYFKRFVSSEYKGVVLAPHNATVQKYNLEGLESVDAPLLTFKASVDGNVNANEFNVDSLIKVKNGCKIMYLVNSKENPLRNGTIGTFVHEEDNYFIEVQNVKYKLEQFEFTKKEYVYDEDKNDLVLKEIGTLKQYPFRLAYALSIHKSQGLTFEEVTVDLTLPCFQKGQMYVALSRVTSPEGLRIIIKN
jgi:ATP-dependent DNA helicase PIF1